MKSIRIDKDLLLLIDQLVDERKLPSRECFVNEAIATFLHRNTEVSDERYLYSVKAGACHMSNDRKILKVLRDSGCMLSVGEIEKSLKSEGLNRQSIYNSLHRQFKEGSVEIGYDLSRGPPRSVYGINTDSPEQIHVEYCREYARVSCAQLYGHIVLAQLAAHLMKPLWNLQTSHYITQGIELLRLAEKV